MFGLEKYNYRTGKDFMVYIFESNGPKGPIQKVAKFNEIGNLIYNFGFGDYNPVTDGISDTSVSNNSDTDIIMARWVALFTILQTLFRKH
jgi:hypothetical protein